jgi:para-aminobenzoate synthetase component 1
MINLLPTLTQETSEVRINDLKLVKSQLVRWAATFPYAQMLDTCESSIDRYGSYELLVGVSSGKNLVTSWDEARKELGEKWLMGGLSYELKNRFEPILSTRNRAVNPVPEVMLFEPETVVYLKRGEDKLHISGPDAGLMEFLDKEPEPQILSDIPSFSANFTRDEYVQTVQKLRNHIEEGDCYEINLSQVYSADAEIGHPEEVYLRLLEISPVPFASMLKWGGYWLLCASPERFLQKEQSCIRTQPIKGTAARSEDPVIDQANKTYLQASLKEQAENVMIVDLSRNDLYRVCKTNTVKVPYLFEIQEFPTVFQMVSTVEGEVEESLKNDEIIEQIFPPGSMTGAPKVRTMQLIDEYERSARGLYAGSVGYFSPDGDFDLNVVIRALQYDAKTNKLAYQVGGAITWDSDPEAEYEETLLKAAAIRRIWE